MAARRTDPWPRPSCQGGLYLIRLSPKHYYGGRSVDLVRRWREHYENLLAGDHCNRRMQAVFNIHRTFEPEVVIPEAPGMDLRAVEQAWLNEHFRKPGCVNLTPDSDGGCAGHTEETCRKMSETRKARPDLVEKARTAANANRRPHSAETREKTRERNRALFTGVKHTPEHIEKVASKNRGRKNTPETLALMSESAKRRSVEKPTVHGEATRQKLSTYVSSLVWVNDGTVNRRLPPSEAETLLATGWKPGRTQNRKPHPPRSPEEAARLRGARKGVRNSLEHIEKTRQAHLGRKNTPDTIAKMSESHRRRSELASTQQKGRVWITDGKANLRMFPEAATPYLSSGWKPGRSGVVTRPDSARRRALEGA